MRNKTEKRQTGMQEEKILRHKHNITMKPSDPEMIVILAAILH